MGERLRVLVVGWPNSPHVVAWADAVTAAGHEVHVAGRNAPQLPPAAASPTVHPLPAQGPPLVRSLRMSRALGRLASELRPDLVHAHWLPEAGWLAAREGLRPLVCSVWGSDVYGLRRIWLRRSRGALRAADLVLADSVDLLRAAKKLRGTEVRGEVVRWGLDLERFSPGDAAAARERLGLHTEGPVVACVRGFDPVYNKPVLLEAFARVRRDHPDARLLLKHPEPAAPPAVTAAVDRLRLDDAVVIVGNLPPERMPDVYRAVDVVVSIPSSDSSPRSVWEALACGRPVVVSDLPWARAELADGPEALIVPIDPEAVADAIARILGERRTADELGKRGRELAATELDPARAAARIDALYRSVIEAAR